MFQQDLKKILNDAKQGYIYFSLGSNIKSNLLPIERRNMLLRTFAELPYTVLWKFESDNLVDKPDNVIIRKWVPQKEVLGYYFVFFNIFIFLYFYSCLYGILCNIEKRKRKEKRNVR